MLRAVKFSDPILVDMDGTCVDMTPVWLKKYYKATGELIKESQISDWDFEKFVKYPIVFHKILEEENFFFNLKPMPGAVKYINKLIKHGYNIVFLTQLPRRSNFAANDKRRWIKRYFPDFDLKDLIFAHRKELVSGMVIFDDNPHHLRNWKEKWAFTGNAITAAIDCPYNTSLQVDWRFKHKSTAWKEFYENVRRYYIPNE